MPLRQFHSVTEEQNVNKDKNSKYKVQSSELGAQSSDRTKA